ncbi:MAG TPA: protein jag [Syntrophothermus lipocalidus]|uniref:RNA-binding protein KhpB n=2 Tax=Syntrophothermus TaxID=129001 RepID=D7CKD3_SYNLT|nr:single-stranded nucleic acid binding R3H domain protein [Syntrophothermus lipocalidus DSM 12680]HHV76613.1 protein jag [Syntrophothermus lipocalidus]
MEMESVEKRGKSVDEAVKAALEELGAEFEDVVIEVLEEPSKGILGVIGKKSAVVRVTLREKPEEKVRETLVNILNSMKLDYEIQKAEFNDGVVRVNIVGKDMGLLIGRKGETLNSLQFLLGLIVNKDRQEKVRVVLDVEDYRLKREESLKNLALKLSDKVKRTRKSIVMRPMSPQERRIVHTVLQNDPSIVTFSQGEEPNRKVVISLKR